MSEAIKEAVTSNIEGGLLSDPQTSASKDPVGYLKEFGQEDCIAKSKKHRANKKKKARNKQSRKSRVFNKKRGK